MRPPLASLADVADIEGAPLDQALLTSAGEYIRRLCEWHIAPTIEETRFVSGTGGPELILPSLHIVDVIQVAEVDPVDPAIWTPLTEYRSIPGGRLLRTAGGWPRGRYNLRVQLRHGYERCPDELKGPLISLADSVGATPVGVRGEIHATGEHSDTFTYFAEGTYSGGSGLPPAIDGILKRYRAV